MDPTDRVLFVGGSFSVTLYAKVNRIHNYALIRNGYNLLGYHNSKPVFFMEDAPDIYGTGLQEIIRVAKENGYVMIQLTYRDKFPTDEELASIMQNVQDNEAPK